MHSRFTDELERMEGRKSKEKETLVFQNFTSVFPPVSIQNHWWWQQLSNTGSTTYITSP
jgi:radical SAM superfamily enzyme